MLTMCVCDASNQKLACPVCLSPVMLVAQFISNILFKLLPHGPRGARPQKFLMHCYALKSRHFYGYWLCEMLKYWGFPTEYTGGNILGTHHRYPSRVDVCDPSFDFGTWSPVCLIVGMFTDSLCMWGLGIKVQANQKNSYCILFNTTL